MVNQVATVSAIIPTRNRPRDLAKAVKSVLGQSRVPEQLVIVDQSADFLSKEAVTALVREKSGTVELVYIHDAAIKGLVAAKKVGVQESSCDIVMFLEDDVVLSEDYIKNLLKGFMDRPEMMGACGVVTQVSRNGTAYQKLFHLFHRGIFHDTRVGTHGNPNGWRREMVSSNYLSGGLSAYRRAVFERVPFDTENGFFMLEDIDFSIRAVRAFGEGKFFINTSAHLDHNMSSTNRAILSPRYTQKLREYVIFYKKNRESKRSLICFLWLLLGSFLEAGFESIHSRHLGPLVGLFKGINQGILWRIQ